MEILSREKTTIEMILDQLRAVRLKPLYGTMVS